MCQINLLFYDDIKIYLEKENFEYLCFKRNEEEYSIEQIAPIYIGYFSDLSEYLCYDYDKLSDYHKTKYIDLYKSFTKINYNIYKIETKQYVLKKTNDKLNPK